MASVHAGVRPWVEQGSSVTYSVAPCGLFTTFLRGLKRLDFRMRQSRPAMPAAPDNFTSYSPARRRPLDWAKLPITAPGQPQRQPHEMVILHPGQFYAGCAAGQSFFWSAIRSLKFKMGAT